MSQPEHEPTIHSSLHRLQSDLYHAHSYFSLQESIERYFSAAVDGSEGSFDTNDIYQLMSEQSFDTPFPSEMLYDYAPDEAVSRTRMFLYDVLVTNQEPGLNLHESRDWIHDLYGVVTPSYGIHTPDMCGKWSGETYEPCELGDCPPRYAASHTLQRATALIDATELHDVSELSTKRAFSHIRTHLTVCEKRKLLRPELVNDAAERLSQTYHALYSQ